VAVGTLRAIGFRRFIALGVLAGMTTAATAGDRGTVARHEQARVTVAARAADGALRMQFFANGRDYHLKLDLNPRLDRWSSGHWRQYTGGIEGNDKSWARLAIADGEIRGVLYDGAELLALEPAAAGELTVYRVPDLKFATPLSFAGDRVRDPERKLAAAAPAPRVQALTAERKLELSVIGDASFRARYDSVDAARDAMLTRLNVVDGIFSAQVGVAIEVASFNIADDVSNALDATTDGALLLDSLGRLRQQTTALNTRGLTHLFTGRDLDGGSVGIAYDSTLCRARYSASLAQAHGSATLDGLISAHEIGHVFGAPHDGEEQCAATPQNQYIMSPVLNSQATTFSQCSLEQMAPLAGSASCLAPLAPADLALPSSLGTHDAAAGARFDWRFAVTNEGDQRAAAARVTVQLTPAIELISAAAAGVDCTLQSRLATCDLPGVDAGSSVEVSVVMRSAAAGTYSAHAQVVSAGDASRSNDEAEGTLRVLAAGASPPPAEPATPARDGKSGGGVIDGWLLAALGALLGFAARRRLALRASGH
jgi:hypothetical protein